MSQDGKNQRIQVKVKNDRPITADVACPCGGTIYASPSAHYAKCSNGEVRCTTCLRPARKFQRAYTCGVGCAPGAAGG